MRAKIKEFLNQRDFQKKKGQIFEVLVSKAPSGLKIHTLQRLLPEITDDELIEVLVALVEEGVVKHTVIKNKLLPRRETHTYSLVEPEKYPPRQTLVIGDIELPRMMPGDTVGAEDLYEIFDALSAYSKSLEDRFEDMTSKMTRRYWANMATLFALFISVFALIIRASDPILVEQPFDYQALFLLKLSELGPIALILFAFSILLWLILRKF